MGSTASAVQAAQAALSNANNFTKSVEGHTPSEFAPAPKKPSYKQSHAARKSMLDDEMEDSNQLGKSLNYNAKQAQDVFKEVEK